jgi:hypothetical protein
VTGSVPQAGVARVRVSQIRRDASVWPRGALNPDRVGEFLTLYLDQGTSALPPIEVVREGRQQYLVAERPMAYPIVWRTGVQIASEKRRNPWTSPT